MMALSFCAFEYSSIALGYFMYENGAYALFLSNRCAEVSVFLSWQHFHENGVCVRDSGLKLAFLIDTTQEHTCEGRDHSDTEKRGI